MMCVAVVARISKEIYVQQDGKNGKMICKKDKGNGKKVRSRIKVGSV